MLGFRLQLDQLCADLAEDVVSAHVLDARMFLFRCPEGFVLRSAHYAFLGSCFVFNVISDRKQGQPGHLRDCATSFLRVGELMATAGGKILALCCHI